MENGGTCDVAVRGVVDSPELIGHGCGWVGAHEQGSSVVVCGAEAVSAARIWICSLDLRCGGAGGHDDGGSIVREDFERKFIRKRCRNLIGERIHRVPYLLVNLGLWSGTAAVADIRHRHFGCGATEVGECRGQSNKTIRIVSGHFADAAHGDDDVRVRGIEEPFQVFNVGNLLEQLRFRVVPELAEAGGRNLQMGKMIHTIEGSLAFHEKGGNLQRLAVGWREKRQRYDWNADCEVGAKMGDQVRSHPLSCAPGKGVLECAKCEACALNCS